MSTKKINIAKLRREIDQLLRGFSKNPDVLRGIAPINSRSLNSLKKKFDANERKIEKLETQIREVRAKNQEIAEDTILKVRKTKKLAKTLLAKSVAEDFTG